MQRVRKGVRLHADPRAVLLAVAVLCLTLSHHAVVLSPAASEPSCCCASLPLLCFLPGTQLQPETTCSTRLGQGLPAVQVALLRGPPRRLRVSSDMQAAFCHTSIPKLKCKMKS